MSSMSTGLDVTGIVDSIMGAQQHDINQLNNQKTLYQNQQTAYNGLKTSLTKLNSTLDNLQAVFNNHLYKTQSGNESIISAVTSSKNTAPGTYNIDVQQLAQSQQITSGVFSSKNTALSLTGDLSIELGTSTLNLALDQNNTLENIRDNINNSLNNPGVTASILKSTGTNGEDEFRLMLTTNDSGTANSMTLGGTSLGSLDLTHETAAAKNAKYTINGFYGESSSNLISDALDGVVLHLNGQTGATTVTVSADMENEEAAITSSIQSFIDSYNAVVDLLAKNQSLSSLRDSTYSIIQMDLKHSMEKVTGNSSIRSLLDLGIKLDAPQKVTNEEGVEYVVGGKLSIDKKQLSKVLSNNSADVESFFTNKDIGFIKNMEAEINDINNNTVTNRVKIINQQTSTTNQKIGREEVRLEETRTRLTIEYAELDAYLNRYNQMSDFLEQQLDSMSSFNKSK